MTIKYRRRNNLTWLIFFLILPNIKPSSISTIAPMIGNLYTIGSYVSVLFVVILILKNQKVKFQPVLTLIFLMEIWIFITTIIHKSEGILSNISSFISSISIPLIIYCFSDNMDELLTALLMNFEWLIYACLLSIFLFYPNGMYISGNKPQYFLGNENGIIFFVIPAIFLALVYIRKEKKYLRGSLLIIACLLNEILVWCATAVIGIAIAGVLMLFCIKRKRTINYLWILGGFIVADIVITVYRTFTQSSLMVFLIDNVLGKSLTMSGRTRIWDQAIALIRDNPLTGLGRGDHVMLWNKAYHAHNEIFQVLLNGGIPLLILFLYLLIYMGKQINKNRYSYGGLLVLAMLTCLYIQFIATSRLTFRIYVPFMLAAYVNNIAEVLELYDSPY